MGPLRQDSSWQARDPDAFDHSHFTILWAEERVICPQGHSSQSWFSLHDPRGYDTLRVKFRISDCAGCPVRDQCTRSTTNGRTLTLASQERYDVIAEARAYQQTDAFKEQYAVRAGVEGTISQAASTLGLRQARYRGLQKTHLQSLLRQPLSTSSA